jgi:cell division protein FtsB
VRLLAFTLFSLLLLIQYPLWLGKGGWFRVWDIERELQAQRETNGERRQRNAALEAQVKDLKGGSDAVEELARAELGMLRRGEVFVQISEPQRPEGAAPSAAGEVKTAAVLRPD